MTNERSPNRSGHAGFTFFMLRHSDIAVYRRSIKPFATVTDTYMVKRSVIDSELSNR